MCETPRVFQLGIRKELLLLVSVLAQSFFALVRSYFVTLSFFTARHVLQFIVNYFVQIFIKLSLESRIVH